jgi:hypothetical protein
MNDVAFIMVQTNDQNDRDHTLAGVIATLEHLAAAAAYRGEPCAQVLFSTANLLRVTAMPERN